MDAPSPPPPQCKKHRVCPKLARKRSDAEKWRPCIKSFILLNELRNLKSSSVLIHESKDVQYRTASGERTLENNSPSEQVLMPQITESNLMRQRKGKLASLRFTKT